MLTSDEIRDLLLVHEAVGRGIVTASDAAAALETYWRERGEEGPRLASALRTAAELSAGALAEAEAAVDGRIEEAGGDVMVALTRRGGLDRSLRAALSGRPSPDGSIPDADAAASLPALRSMASGRYVEFVPVGQGGMGVVHLALDTELSRLVAVKTVRPPAPAGKPRPSPFTPLELELPARASGEWADFEELEARFLQEAWVTGGLEHPGVVPIHELGRTAHGVPYYTMRFVRGMRTLRDAIARVRRAPFEDRSALLEPFLKLCDTVRYAHSKGVIHRDIKPENVALGEFGEVVLLDWGLAKLEGTQELAATQWQDRVRAFRAAGDMHTMVGAIGSPGYMAPEAALGRLDEIDRKSDLYGLGVILFEILTGQRPHPGPTAEDYLRQVAGGDARPAHEVAADVPLALSALCADCLSRDRGRRPQDVEALTSALRRWQAASALEREVEEHVRDARAALDAAASAAAGARLAHVDRAAAALQLVEAKRPEDEHLPALRARGQALREAGIREREKASGRRLLIRVGILILALAGVAGYVVAARFESTSRERGQDLDRILRLADAKKASDLREEVRRLSASQLDLAQRVQAWRLQADELGRRRPAHEAALAALRRQAASGPPWRFASLQLEWQHQVLVDLLAELDALADPAGEARRTTTRLATVARQIDHATSRHEADWEATTEAVAAHPLYGGLGLAPQRGLVPLGPDPHSGLYEFAHIGSGVLPIRDPSSGELILPDDFAVVLVLIPAGTFWMGAQDKDPAGRNFDPDAIADPTRSGDEGPVHRVVLRAPFFLAKHECTQAQWAAMSDGARQSFFGYKPRQPVEQVTWDECVRWLRGSGLDLPSEAQWEYACRAGTQTPWWTGTGTETLLAAGWVNVNAQRPADEAPAVYRGSTRSVGSKRANPFGLHDVHGNVWELCRSVLAPYPRTAERDVGEESLRVIRGGSWYDGAVTARSSSRSGALPSYRCFHTGVRPYRPVTEAE